jgi:glycosyl transferase family 25
MKINRIANRRFAVKCERPFVYPEFNINKAMKLFENTLFINLKHRVDRLEHIQNEFKKMGINGERFDAIMDDNGAIGCTKSHIRCLELAIERDYEQIFICEDDITFLNCETLQNSLQKFNQNCHNWDVLIIGGNLIQNIDKTNKYFMRISDCQTTTGYIVQKHYFKTLLDNFYESLENLIKTKSIKNYAIDIHWKHLQRKDNWYILLPLTVSQIASYSDIEKYYINYSYMIR